MILIDTGPLVALLNIRDQDHERCAAVAKSISEVELVTTWPCYTEAMYLLYREGGQPYQEALWELRSSGILSIHASAVQEEQRMRQMMVKYADSPMDLADASLIATAEALSLTKVFTIDKHFRTYRLANGEFLDIVP